MANQLSGSSEQHYPELLTDLRDQLSLKLASEGVEVEKAQRIARAAAEHIRQHWGGQNVYFPQGLPFEVRQRAIALYQEFDGRNLAALAQRNEISVMTAYRWLRYARSEYVRTHQGDLFGGSSDDQAGESPAVESDKPGTNAR